MSGSSGASPDRFVDMGADDEDSGPSESQIDGADFTLLLTAYPGCSTSGCGMRIARSPTAWSSAGQATRRHTCARHH